MFRNFRTRCFGGEDQVLFDGLLLCVLLLLLAAVLGKYRGVYRKQQPVEFSVKTKSVTFSEKIEDQNMVTYFRIVTCATKASENFLE